MDAGAARAEGAEDTKGAAGCPNTVLTAATAAAPGVATVLDTAAGAGVELTAVAVLITGLTPKELLSVVAMVG